MNRIVYINGMYATKADKKLLNYNILHNNLKFDVTEENGIQYVTTFD